MPCPNHADVVAGLVPCARCGVEFCRDCVVELDGMWFDAACKEERVRDIKSGTAGAEFDLAGVTRRFFGNVVDGFVTGAFFIVGLVVMLAANLSAKDMVLPIWVAIVAIPTAYEALFLSSGGRTFGKIVF